MSHQGLVGSPPHWASYPRLHLPRHPPITTAHLLAHVSQHRQGQAASNSHGPAIRSRPETNEIARQTSSSDGPESMLAGAAWASALDVP